MSVSRLLQRQYCTVCTLFDIVLYTAPRSRGGGGCGGALEVRWPRWRTRLETGARCLARPLGHDLALRAREPRSRFSRPPASAHMSSVTRSRAVARAIYTVWTQSDLKLTVLMSNGYKVLHNPHDRPDHIPTSQISRNQPKSHHTTLMPYDVRLRVQR